MAYYNDGKTFRNLPEQVDKNKTDIEEMQSTVEADGKNINDNMNKILAHDTRINALETTKLSAVDDSIKLTRSNAEMGSVSIAKVGGNTLVNGSDIPLATINGESIMQNKDFTIDSNLSSLLWANLGIGRWRNAVFRTSSWTSTCKITDELAKYYSNCSYMFSGLSWVNQDGYENNYKDVYFSNPTTFFNSSKHISYYNAFASTQSTGAIYLPSMYGNFAFAFTGSKFKKILIDNNCFVKCTIAGNSFANNCPNLEEIGAFDMSENTNNLAAYINNSPKVKSIHCTHWKVSFNISASTAFENADLVEILNNLDTVSTTQTLTMGATNLAKLSSSDILIATGKGWQLA